MEQLRQWTRRFDWGFVVVLAITFLALWPFLSRPSLPEGTDAELHIFRLAELSYLLRGGEFYPRWAPNFYHGYGYPIFNYYAPLTYYLGFLLEVTPWFDPVGAVKGIFIVGFLLAGLGMYGFVRDNWGRRAGYVAAAVFLYAPYVHYIDPHVRGVLPESFSFGAFAVALWALDRLRRSGRRWPWLAAIIAVGAVIMSHNLMGLLFFGLLSAWALWHVIFVAPDGPARALTARRLFPALLLGLGLAAIFWLPVFLERNAINVNTLIGENDNYDFHTHFLSVWVMLAPSLRLDWGAAESAFRFNLGVAQWLLGGLGLLALLLGRARYARHMAFFALALAALIFLMLPVSTFVWEAVPFLPYFQFPWRLLGAAAAMLAILAGGGAEALLRLLGERWERLARPRAAAGLTAALVALPLILALPLTQPAPWPDFGDVHHLRMSLIENTGRWLGTTSTADYVPVTVDIVPARKGSVVANFGLGLPPDRVNWEMLPEGATVDTEVVRPLLTRYVVDMPKETRLRLYQFDFPGWQVRIDGEPAITEIGRPEGFLVIPVPAGEHVVEVEFGSTPARTLATALSLLSLGLALVLAWRLPGAEDQERTRQPFRDGPVLVVVLLIGALGVLLLEPLRVLHYNSPDYVAQPAQVQTYENFGDQIALLGFDASTTSPAPGDTLELTLYWQAVQPLDINYQVFVHVLGPQGLVAQSDKINPGDFPTRRWPETEYVRDRHRLTLPADLAPGDYTVSTGLWVQSEGWRLPVFDEAEQQVGDNVPLFSFTVAP